MLAPVACDDDSDTNRDGAVGPVSDGGGGARGGDGAAVDASNAPLTQVQAAGVIVEANAGEVEVGGLALSRASQGATKSFAMQMVEEHSAAQQRLLSTLNAAGLQPAESAIKDALANMTQATLADLSQRTGAAFDTAYLQSQVAMHQTVLTLLDTRVLPVVTNPQLRAELTMERASVVMHLERAQQLLGINPDAGAGGTGGGGAGGSTGSGGSGGSDGGAHDAGVDAADAL
jgi:putative membrane protein